MPCCFRDQHRVRFSMRREPRDTNDGLARSHQFTGQSCRSTHHHETRGDPNTSFEAAKSAQVNPTQTLNQTEAGTDGSFGLMLVRLWITKVSEDSVAQRSCYRAARS